MISKVKNQLFQILIRGNSIWKQWIKSHIVEMPLQIPIIIIVIVVVITAIVN